MILVTAHAHLPYNSSGPALPREFFSTLDLIIERHSSNLCAIQGTRYIHTMDIISAVRAQDLDAIEAAIERGEDVNSVDPLDNVMVFRGFVL